MDGEGVVDKGLNHVIAKQRKRQCEESYMNYFNVFNTASLNCCSSGKRIQLRFYWIWDLVKKNLISALKSLLDSSVVLP